MYDLTIPVSALALVFYLIAFFHVSVGLDAGPYGHNQICAAYHAEHTAISTDCCRRIAGEKTSTSTCKKNIKEYCLYD